MLIEHPSHAYDAKLCWPYLEAKSEFVASAAWKEWRHSNTSFNGPSSHRETVRLVSAECDCLETLRGWCAEQISGGADLARIHRTWPIPERQAPSGHRLNGKRDNAFIEGIAA